MDLSREKEIETKILKLAQVILRVEATNLSNSYIQNLCRYLKYQSSQSSSNLHQHAIKIRLREQILSNYSPTYASSTALMTEKTQDGVINVTKFDEEVDNLRKKSSRYLNSFLVIFQAICFKNPFNSHSKYFPLVSNQQEKKSTQPPSEPSLSTASANLHLGTTTLPIGIPPRLNEDEVTLLNDHTLWISKDVEYLILRDLLLIFQGINGVHIKLDDRSQAYIIDPDIIVPPPARDVVLCLCELGWLYGRVAQYLKILERDDTRGLIAQAFGHTLQHSLNDYFRLLAVLEQELSRSQNSASPASVSDTASGTTGLSLIRLRVWMQEPLERMSLLARLVEGATPLHGGGIIRRLHGYSAHGDERTQAFMKETVLHGVCVPLYSMISRWILHGELYDPYHEFFISTNAAPTHSFNSLSPDLSTIDYVWHKYYTLNPGMLPPFLSLSLAKKILVVGKSINFMKACSKYSDRLTAAATNSKGKKIFGPVSIDHFTLPPSLLANTSLQNMSYGNESDLEQIVYSIARVIESTLLNIVQNQFHLSVHLSALKKFLLLGQGDFVTCLLDNVGVELKRRANELMRHNLTGLLEGSLRSCNAQFEPSFVLDRLGVKLLDPSPGDTGWEIFALDYKIDAPIAAVLHSEALHKYGLLFSLLWKLKRVEWTLSSAWRTQITFLHTRGHQQLRKLKPILHRCALERGKMTHLINNMTNYFMFEVIETAYQRLEQGVTEATCLDDIIRVHDTYLSEIYLRALQSELHENLNTQLQHVIQAILRFCNLEEALISGALSVVARENSGPITWSGQERYEGLSDPPGSIDGVPGYVISRIEESAQNYELQFQKLMKLLSEYGEKAGDFTRYLSFHLDLDILGMNSVFSDESGRKGDDESDARSETLSEMSDFNPSGYAGYVHRPTGTNPLSVSQIVASEDIDAAPTVPSLPDKKSESDSKSSATKRSSSAGRAGGVNAATRLSGGSGGSRSLSGVGDLSRGSVDRSSTSIRTPSQVPSSSSAAGATKRSSFGSSSRSLSGGGGGGSKPTR